MSIANPLVGSPKVEGQTAKQWAAEDIAISMGLLRECPYHGQPFKARPASGNALGTGVIDPLDPMVKVFGGNTREMMAAVEQVTGHYGERCAYCAAQEQEDYDD